MSDRPATTKARILDAAEGLMLAKSFHSVGLNEILAAVGVPKGSFYHYFKSKEQFGVEMLQHYVDGATAHKRRLLLSPDPEPDPLLRLLNYYEAAIDKSHRMEGKCPCLVIKLAAEVGDFSEPMRQVLADGSRQWIGLLQEVLQQGIARGRITEGIEPASAAAVIEDLWTGAVQRAATLRDSAPLKEAVAFIRNWLSP